MQFLQPNLYSTFHRSLITEYPDSDVYFSFTDEDGTLKWVVKACPPEADETAILSDARCCEVDGEKKRASF